MNSLTSYFIQENAKDCDTSVCKAYVIKFTVYLALLFYLPWFLDPHRTVRSDRDNREPLTNTVLLTTKIVLCTKSTKPFESRLNRLDLRTVNDSHGSDQRLKKKKKKITSSQHLITMVEASTTMRFCQTLKILRSHHLYLTSSVSRLFSVQNFFS